MDIANEEEPYKWIDEEIGLALNNIKLIITITLQNWFNLILDKLAIVPLVLIPVYNFSLTALPIPPATLTAVLLVVLITVLLATLIAVPLATLTTPPEP